MKSQLQVIVSVLHSQEKQSPSLKQESPGPKEPGVHDGAPLLLAPLLLDPEHVTGIVPLALPHSEGHMELRHAAVETEAAEGLPQLSMLVQAATVPPSKKHSTRHVQFASTAHAAY
jgi:hypothetical protein